MSLDNIIDIDINLSSPAITRAGFGTPLILCLGLSAMGAELVRYYASSDEIDADADLTTDAKNRAKKAFSQSPSPDTVGIGQRATDVAQVDTAVVTGATNGTYTITINGTAFSYVASASTVGAIRDALVTAINAGAEPVTAAPVSTDTLTITADDPGEPISSIASSTGSSITLSTTTANVNVATVIADVAAYDSNWYGLVLDTRDHDDVVRAAAQIEAMKKIFIGQTSEAAAITVATTDAGAVLKAASYQRTHVGYMSDDALMYDVALMATLLAADFDAEAPTASLQTLEGVTSEELGTTAENFLKSKNVGYYTTLFGIGATADTKTAAGYDLELIVTRDWVDARMSEAVAQFMINESNSRRRVTYDDRGFNQIAAVAEAAALVGEEVGHFVPGTVVFEVPRRADVASADSAASRLRIRFGAQYSGRTKTVSISGYVSQDFAGL